MTNEHEIKKELAHLHSGVFVLVWARAPWGWMLLTMSRYEGEGE